MKAMRAQSTDTDSSSSEKIHLAFPEQWCLLIFDIFKLRITETKGYHDNSSTDISSTTLRLQTFRLL